VPHLKVEGILVGPSFIDGANCYGAITNMKPGSRLKSAVCDCEIMIIRCGEGAIECGGSAMGETKPSETAALNQDHSNGTLVGKRYVDAEGKFELLCVKAGRGSLSVNGVALLTKEAKPLPSSD
jgi:hypothetical protein